MWGNQAFLARLFQAAVGILVFGISIGSIIFHGSSFLSLGKTSFSGSPRIDDRGSGRPSGFGFCRGFLLPGARPRFLPFLQCATAPVRFGSRVDDTMTAYRLSKAVNDSRNEREDLIEPVA